MVDLLLPPRFEPSGEVKPLDEAIAGGHWLGVINFWILRPGPALLYQQRADGGWAPGTLDGSAAGYYRAGERGLDGLREVEEELGRSYSPERVTSLGRRLNVGVDLDGRELRAAISVYAVFDDAPLRSFTLDPTEVPAIFEVSVDTVDLLFEEPGHRLTVHGIDCTRQPITRTITCEDFSYSWDGYHQRIAALARRVVADARGHGD